MTFSCTQRAALAALRGRLEDMAAVPLPGGGRTDDRWRWLARLAADDLSAVRLAEGHLDAVAILAEGGRIDLLGEGTWGVWAAEPGRMRADRIREGRWRLTGEKRWCSGSVALDRALVTATATDGPRLFAVDATVGGVVPGSWQPMGMEATASHTLGFDVEVGADGAIGGPGWYVERPGFWHGGAGVASCWYGGAIGVAEGLRRRAVGDGGQGSAAAAWGRVRARLDAAGALLEQAAWWIDRYPEEVEGARVRARTARLAVAELAELVLSDVNLECGAGALAHDEAHWRKVADLTVYLRQLHPFPDALALGAHATDTYTW